MALRPLYGGEDPQYGTGSGSPSYPQDDHALAAAIRLSHIGPPIATTYVPLVCLYMHTNQGVVFLDSRLEALIGSPNIGDVRRNQHHAPPLGALRPALALPNALER